MRILGLLATLLPSLVLASPPLPDAIDTLALGSCLRQDRPQPIWQAVLASHPDVFVALGDNVYADTTDPATMRAAYAELAADPGYRALRERVPVLPTWDDHDYGANDAGADYALRDESQRIFADFFGLAADSPVRTRAGVYDAHVVGPPGRRVQIILLDTRYFRGPLQRGLPSLDCPRGTYVPSDDPEASMLGESQWAWLADRLREPADLRLLASSIQVVPDEHCFEKWSNLPRERERLFRVLRETGATGVILLSGDRHHAEISRLPAEVVGYPLYELTSSSLNAPGGRPAEGNRHRATAEGFGEANFGIVRIDWDAPEARVTLQVRDVEGRTVLEQAVPLRTLQPAAPPRITVP